MEENKMHEGVQESKVERTFLYRFVVALYWIIAKVLYGVRIEGKENIPKGVNCVMMGNHQAIFDPLLLAACVPDREIRFMGKKELWNNKILGWAFTKVHGFPVDRGNMDMTAVRTAMNLLKEGKTLGIFPEGTRSRSGHMLPLLGGASLMALRAGVDVVPVYIDGNYKPFTKMIVRVGKPIDTSDLRAGRINKDTCDVLTERMTAAFAQLSGGKSLPPAAQEAQSEI